MSSKNIEIWLTAEQETEIKDNKKMWNPLDFGAWTKGQTHNIFWRRQPIGSGRYIKSTINGHFYNNMNMNMIISNVQLGVALFFTYIPADHFWKWFGHRICWTCILCVVLWYYCKHFEPDQILLFFCFSLLSLEIRPHYMFVLRTVSIDIFCFREKWTEIQIFSFDSLDFFKKAGTVFEIITLCFGLKSPATIYPCIC